MPLTSLDVTKDRVARLREMFPEAFVEGRIDFRRLRENLGDAVDEGAERYGLSWAGRADAVKAVQSLSTGTLVPVKEESVNFDQTENVIIEGDNLEVLKLLQKSYHERIKMIYIDPPYNTGNEFIYPDNFKEGLQDYLRYSGQVNGEGIRQTTNSETSGRYHSNWLSMMYPRLFLAKNLLRRDGVILVSIADQEVHNLRMLMDDVLGEENFIAQLVWEKTRKNDAKLFSVGHDYILVYARSMTRLKELKTVWREPKAGAKEIMEEYRALRNKYGSDDGALEIALRDWYKGLPEKHPSKKLSRYKQVDKNGPWRDRDISWQGGGGPRYDVVHPKTKQPCKVPERGWGFATPESMQRQINLGLVVFREDHTQPPFRKAHLVPVPEELDDDDVVFVSESENGDGEEEAVGMQVMPSVLYKQSQVAVKYLRSLMGDKIFDNPKDHEVIARLIRYCTAQNGKDIVLDFFAGSGTTGEAVLELNKQEVGNRKFILTQLPEPTPENSRARELGYENIAQITKARVRRAISKLNDTDNGKLPDENVASQDRGFKVFKLTSSNFRIWDGDEVPKDAEGLAAQLRLYANHVNVERSQADILYEILLKAGFPLTAPVEEKQVVDQIVHTVADGQLLVCLADPINLETLRGMIELKPRRVMCLDLAFRGNDQLKTNIVLEMKSHGVEFRTV